MERCINQIFRPHFVGGIKIDGFGDCRICTTDEKNFLCRGYQPVKIKIWKIEIKNPEDEVKNKSAEK